MTQIDLTDPALRDLIFFSKDPVASAVNVAVSVADSIASPRDNDPAKWARAYEDAIDTLDAVGAGFNYASTIIIGAERMTARFATPRGDSKIAHKAKALLEYVSEDGPRLLMDAVLILQALRQIAKPERVGHGELLEFRDGSILYALLDHYWAI